MANYRAQRKTYCHQKRTWRKAKWFILLLLLIVLTTYGIAYMERIMKPIITSITELKVKATITETVNTTIREEFLADTDIRKLLNLQMDQEGMITYVEANTAAMNDLAAGLATSAQTKFNQMEPQSVEVPVGSLLGSQILSEMGPDVSLKVSPIGMTKANFRTEFESCGINQTKYKVYLDFESQAQVLVPFSKDIIKVNDTILVAEAIIVGRVPNTYVQVPKDQITEVLDIAH